MKMQNDEIRSANRKAMPKFLIAIGICVIVGFTGGFLASWYGLDALTGGLKGAGAFFGTYIAPWAMLAIVIALPLVCVPIYRSAKRQADTWDGENEEIYAAVDKKLSLALWISNVAFILAYFLIAASYSGGFAIFEDKTRTAFFFVAIVCMFAVIFETIFIGQKCVDTTKRMNPEKEASVYDLKFQKKWFDSCDEAEKIMIGKCAYKAYTATSKACSVLAGVLAVCALIFDIGFLPSFSVCFVWIVNQSVYCKEAMKYNKAGTKIR
mgnify:CR=1 FL=1